MEALGMIVYLLMVQSSIFIELRVVNLLAFQDHISFSKQNPNIIQVAES